MDIVIEFPQQTSFTVTCTMCKDGTVIHAFQVSRVTNGWTMYMDGASQGTATCTCFANDAIDQTYNQVPFVIEAGVDVTQSAIDNSFQVGKSYDLLYQQLPVGSGGWFNVPHARAYYSFISGTDFNVGTVSAPTWASVNTDGSGTTKYGTITHLNRLPPSTQLW